MPTRKQEKRRRKLRVHGPSADAVGAPPTGRKPPREDAPAARTQRSGRREPAVPSLKRSARKGAIMGLFLLVIVFVTSRGKNSPVAPDHAGGAAPVHPAVRALRPLDGPQGLQEGHGPRSAPLAANRVRHA